MDTRSREATQKQILKYKRYAEVWSLTFQNFVDSLFYQCERIVFVCVVLVQVDLNCMKLTVYL